ADGYDSWNLPERIFAYSITPQSSTAYLPKRTLPPNVEGWEFIFYGCTLCRLFCGVNNIIKNYLTRSYEYGASRTE
ncbi:MAG: hypothetical protein IKC94_02110, partial [Lentisphaeria bacterium]|nr:hypothetical protein [Lentisphaeria bacterium]